MGSYGEEGAKGGKFSLKKKPPKKVKGWWVSRKNGIRLKSARGERSWSGRGEIETLGLRGGCAREGGWTEEQG